MSLADKDIMPCARLASKTTQFSLLGKRELGRNMTGSTSLASFIYWARKRDRCPRWTPVVFLPSSLNP